jgi:hypothetical protein
MGGFVALDRVPACEGRGTGSTRIYALVDPIYRDVRYVGVTSKSLASRLTMHLSRPTNPRTHAWFAGLRAIRLTPAIVTLQAVPSNWERAEMEWIAWFRVRGDLLNMDAGGEVADRGSGWDDIKREKVCAFMATARAQVGSWQLPPCARAQQGEAQKKGGHRKKKVRIHRAPIGLDPIRVATQRERCQEVSIHPTVRRNGRVVRLPT